MSFWFECHSDLPRHPKTVDFQHIMGWDNDKAVAKIIKLLCWVGEYANLGDISRFTDDQIGAAVGCMPGEESTMVCRALERARWIDVAEGMRRVHDWTDYTKRWLGDNQFRKDRAAYKSLLESYRKEFPEPDDECDLLSDCESATRKPENVAVSKEILEYLNKQAGKSYRQIPTHLDLISRRFIEVKGDKDGILMMIDRMVKRWVNDPKMCHYLRPITLFNKSHFSEYYDTRHMPLKPVAPIAVSKQVQPRFDWRKK